MLYFFSRRKVTEFTITNNVDSHASHQSSLYLFPSNQPTLFGLKPPEHRPALWNNIISSFRMPSGVKSLLLFTPDILQYLQYNFNYDPDISIEDNIKSLFDAGVDRARWSGNHTDNNSELLMILKDKGSFTANDWGDAFVKLAKTFPELNLHECPHRFKPRIAIVSMGENILVPITESYYVNEEGMKFLTERKPKSKENFHGKRFESSRKPGGHTRNPHRLTSVNKR